MGQSTVIPEKVWSVTSVCCCECIYCALNATELYINQPDLKEFIIRTSKFLVRRFKCLCMKLRLVRQACAYAERIFSSMTEWIWCTIWRKLLTENQLGKYLNTNALPINIQHAKSTEVPAHACEMQVQYLLVALHPPHRLCKYPISPTGWRHQLRPRNCQHDRRVLSPSINRQVPSLPSTWCRPPTLVITHLSWFRFRVEVLKGYSGIFYL